jgi:hypothetical protein
MKTLRLFTILTLFAAISACDEYGIFEREQYKNVFALLSTDGYNIFQVVYDLEKGSDVGYISASVGGTILPEKDIDIEMVEDPSLIEDYNQANYDVEIWRFAKQLPKSMYNIASMSIKIPAGERTGRTAVVASPEGISPDSTYFIPVRVQSYSACEINSAKSTMLYQVQIKNRWAIQGGTTYTLRGMRNGANVSGTQRVDPIGKNKVRIFAGTEAFASDLEKISAYALILEIANDGKVTIKPHRSMQVTQIDDDPVYPNKYFIDNDGFRTYKTFLLRYDYVSAGTTYQMQQELRLEFDEDEED